MLNAETPNRKQLSRNIKAFAHELGFVLCRITPITHAPHADFFQAWIDEGRAGEMHYLARHVEKRRDPAQLAEEGPPFRSIIVLGVDYRQFDLPPALRDDPSRGIIASYAWGDDYHELIRPLLYKLDAYICTQTGRTTRAKCLVDTGPVLERDWAQRAGLGFTGKNCCTIHPVLGSWLFLAVVLIPEEPTYDAPPRARIEPHDRHDPPSAAVLAGLEPAPVYGRWEIPLQEQPQTHNEIQDSETGGYETGSSETRLGTCGSCTRCLVACPTDAFVGPFHLDPQRCISYWTIETREPVPRALRPYFGNRIFGCDICQEVCPWNQRLPDRTPRLAGLQAHQDRIAIPLLEGFAPETPYWLEREAFNARFRRSPIRRAKREGMLRNVCVALGNWAAPDTVPALTQALHDPAALARGHAAWALGQILRRHSIEAAGRALHHAQKTETEAWVHEEIAGALQRDD